MKKRYLLMTVVMGVLFLFGAVAWAHEVSVFDSQENLIIRAYSSTPATDQACTPGPFCVNLEVRDPNSTPTSGNLVPLTNLVGLNANPLQVHADATTDDLSLAFDDKTGTTFLFCKNGNFMVMTYNIGRAGGPAVDGVCGSSNGGSFYSIPTTNLCSSGTASGVSGTGPWTWTCTGNSGINGSCSATKKVDGVCGSSDGGIFTSAPTTNLCSSGTASGVSGTGPWTWTCTGNSGINGSCSAQLQSTGGGSSDLIISTFGAPTSFSNGVPFSMSVTIKNQGSGAAGPFKVKFYFSTNTTRDSADRLLVTWDVPGLAPGQSLSYSTPSVAVSGTTHFYYYLIAVVDADSQVAETNESNNTKTRSMFCGN